MEWIGKGLNIETPFTFIYFFLFASFFTNSRVGSPETLL